MKPAFLSLAIALFSLVAAPATAQVAVQPYFGALVFDDSGVDGVLEIDPGALVGARLLLGVGDSWRLEGGYGFSPLSVDVFDQSEQDDIDVHLVYGGLTYVGGSDATRVLLSGGFGFMALSSEDLDTSADPMASVAIGFTHPIGERVTFRGEVRDHIVFCSADLEEVSACFFDDQALNHIEVSGGVEIWF